MLLRAPDIVIRWCRVSPDSEGVRDKLFFLYEDLKRDFSRFLHECLLLPSPCLFCLEEFLTLLCVAMETTVLKGALLRASARCTGGSDRPGLDWVLAEQSIKNFLNLNSQNWWVRRRRGRQILYLEAGTSFPEATEAGHADLESQTYKASHAWECLVEGLSEL